MMLDEIRNELTQHIIPFWMNLRDDEYGGYYGYMDYNLSLDEKGIKGCILNNRIIWFFSNAYLVLKDEKLLDEARHAYEFLRDHCIDRENGGVFWSMTYDGRPEDTTKHTYNQAFCVYALASYYAASKDKEALNLAYELFNIIENKCTDDKGYLEAFDIAFNPVSNEKLSENGVMAEKTMNTLLHAFEAYTELYRVDHNPKIKEKLLWILDIFETKIYNPKLHRQEVFFDKDYHSLIDLYSYGHDIETSWLLDRGLTIIDEPAYREKMDPIIMDLANNVKKEAFNGQSLANECECGRVSTKRIWWVQAETLVGFINAYQKSPERKDFLTAAHSQWEFIRDFQIDKRHGSEWYAEVSEDGTPDPSKEIVEPWKCPYHNGRMCLELLTRGIE